MVEPREDPRYVDSDDPRAVLVAWGGEDESADLMDLGGWTDDDHEAFLHVIQHEALGYVSIMWAPQAVITAAAVAAGWGISDSTVRHAISRDGRLPAYRAMGRDWLVRVEDVVELWGPQKQPTAEWSEG